VTPEVLVISSCGFNLSAAAEERGKFSNIRAGTICPPFATTGSMQLTQTHTLIAQGLGSSTA
jgi:hypothetical protein